MTPPELCHEAARRGLRLEQRGDKLAVIPAKRCSPEFADVLRQNKRELLDLLEARAPEHWGNKVEPQRPGGQSIAPLIICVSSEEMPVAKAALTAPKTDGQIAAPQEAAALSNAAPATGGASDNPSWRRQ